MDWMDGSPSAYGWTSRLGKWLDPLADKLLLVSVFLVLTWLGHVPRYLAVCAVGRDVLIVLGAVVFRMAWGPLRGRPILSSKINTGLQLLYVLLVVTHAAWARASRLGAPGTGCAHHRYGALQRRGLHS